MQLTTGSVEAFGAELSPNKTYDLSGIKLALFSYDGATVSLEGDCDVEYMSSETPMAQYLNTFLALETLRASAHTNAEDAPRILLVGESRHSVAKILVNYSVRMGLSPTLVNLDPGKGTFLFPGVLTAQKIDRLVSIEDGFPDGQLCSYFSGNYSAADNLKMFQKLMSRLAFSVNGRLASCGESDKAGAIIIAPKDSESIMQEIGELFRVNLIMVIGSDRLYNSVVKRFTGQSHLSVLKLPMSGGVVQEEPAFSKAVIQHQFKRYFYGLRSEFTPFPIIRGYDEIKIRRLGEEALAPSSALPLGATRKVLETRLARQEPSQASLLYSVLAVPWTSEEEELVESNVACFVYVTGVDEAKRQVTLLSPCPGDLPSPFLLLESPETAPPAPWDGIYPADRYSPGLTGFVIVVARDKKALALLEYDYAGQRRSSKNFIPEGLQIKQCKSSSDGMIIACSSAADRKDLAERCRIPKAALDFSISPSGNFVSIFGKPSANSEAMDQCNLTIWKVDAAPLQIAAFQHRHQASWMPQWTSDEKYFARHHLTNEVHFYRIESCSRPAFKICAEGLTAFSLSPGPYPKVAIFIRELAAEPAVIKIFLLPNTTVPVASKHFFKADKIDFSWSPTGTRLASVSRVHSVGKHLLALSHTEVDTTGQSYYGENNLYFIAGDGSTDCRVALDKAGPVHDMSWGPKGDEFIVCYGYMPSKITLFNLKCEAAFQFPVESKNHVRYSPAGNLICFGGFGNLPGNVEIWTRSGTNLKRVAFIQAPSSSICEWAPSGHVLITAIVTPRLRVDNGFKLWSWKGEPLDQQSFEELYQAFWNSCPASSYPTVDYSNAALKSVGVNSAVEPAKAQPYRPPAFRDKNDAKLGSPGLRSQANALSGQKPAAVAIQMATISSGLSEKEKAVRKLERKLEQIHELKAKMTDGLPLELNQIEKLKTEAEVKNELHRLKAMPDN